MIGNSNAPTKNIVKTCKVNWYGSTNIDVDGDYIRGYFSMPNSQMYNYILVNYPDGRYDLFVLWDLKKNTCSYGLHDSYNNDLSECNVDDFWNGTDTYKGRIRCKFKKRNDKFYICSNHGSGAISVKFDSVTFI